LKRNLKADAISDALERFSTDIQDYPDGIILPVDKPYRWTSADVIRKLKIAACRHFGRKNLKVGHAGTLDPLATGLLLVCIGPATRKAEELQRSRKEYVAGVSFGAVTASYDLEKPVEILSSPQPVNETLLRDVLPSFIGEQDQIAPLFSAKSVDGVRAYETARKLFRQGESVDASGVLSANRINIYDLEILSFFNNPPILPEHQREDSRSRINVTDLSGFSLPTAMLRVSCSKGTYIRALARDLGEAVGSGAFLSSLRRTENGGFRIEDAFSIEEAVNLLSVGLE